MLRSLVVLLLAPALLPRRGGRRSHADAAPGARAAGAARSRALLAGRDRRPRRQQHARGAGGLCRRGADAGRVDAGRLRTYTITEADAAGPFAGGTRGHDGAGEAAGAGLRVDPRSSRRALPRQPGAAQGAEPFGVVRRRRADRGAQRRAGAARRRAAKVVVDQSDRAVLVQDAAGKVLARYPASMGSEHDPLPIGEWKINGTSKDAPVFNYNPDLFWDADLSHSKAKIPRRAEQPGRPRLDRSVEGALRHPRHAAARERRQDAVARLHPPDQLGRRSSSAPWSRPACRRCCRSNA